MRGQVFGGEHYDIPQRVSQKLYAVHKHHIHSNSFKLMNIIDISWYQDIIHLHLAWIIFSVLPLFLIVNDKKQCMHSWYFQALLVNWFRVTKSPFVWTYPRLYDQTSLEPCKPRHPSQLASWYILPFFCRLSAPLQTPSNDPTCILMEYDYRDWCLYWTWLWQPQGCVLSNLRECYWWYVTYLFQVVISRGDSQCHCILSTYKNLRRLTSHSIV